MPHSLHIFTLARIHYGHILKHRELGQKIEALEHQTDFSVAHSCAGSVAKAASVRVRVTRILIKSEHLLPRNQFENLS